jgi:sporulation protein YlmC with PRC-barrel domain
MINKYSRMGAALAVALCAASPLAMAQSATRMTNSNGVVEDTIRPNQIRANKMIGASVYDRNDAKIGSVSDIVLDRDGRVDVVVVDVGGFLGMGSKDVAVRLSDIKTDHNRLTLDMTKPQLQQMSEYHLTNGNTGAGTTESPVRGGHLGSGAGR